VEQESVGSQADYLQTRRYARGLHSSIPGKARSAHTGRSAFSNDSQDVPLLGLFNGTIPHCALEVLRTRFAKLIELIKRGQAQKATARFGRFHAAVLPLLAASELLRGSYGESGTFQWIVPPEERSRRKTAEDKNRPPDAPTLRRKPTP